MKPIGPTAFGHRRTHLGAHGLRAAARPVAEAGKMCVSGLFGRNASGRGRTWHVHARRMNMAGCWTWVLEAHGEQGVQMKASHDCNARQKMGRHEILSSTGTFDGTSNYARGWEL
jgi:hypothetical protein